MCDFEEESEAGEAVSPSSRYNGAYSWIAGNVKRVRKEMEKAGRGR